MDITFQLTGQDIIHYYQFHAKRNSAYKVIFIVFIMFFVLVLTDSLLWFIEGQIRVSTFVGSFVPLTFVTVVLWLIQSRFYYQFFVNYCYSNASPVFERATITISPEGVTRQSDSISSFFRWKAIHDTMEDPLMIYIYTDKRQAYIIPKRAFPNAVNAKQFYITARSYVEALKKRPAKVMPLQRYQA